jgi:hypothetical protein
VYATEIEIREVPTLKLLRRHPRAYRKGELHLPDAERVFNTSRQTHRILDLAHSIGPKTHARCLALFDQRGREAQKTMWGVVRLVPRFPPRIVEQAVETAVAREHYSLKAIRGADHLIAKYSGGGFSSGHSGGILGGRRGESLSIIPMVADSTVF